jgi:hypothetical protein
MEIELCQHNFIGVANISVENLLVCAVCVFVFHAVNLKYQAQTAGLYFPTFLCFAKESSKERRDLNMLPHAQAGPRPRLNRAIAPHKLRSRYSCLE